MHGNKESPQERGAAAYLGEDVGGRIEVLGSRVGSDPGAGAVITLRHLDHPEWAVTLAFGSSGVAALIVKPYVPVPPQSDLAAEFQQSIDQWSSAEVGVIPENSPPVTARLLRRLPIGELESWGFGWLRASSAVVAEAMGAGHLREWFGDDDRSPGRRGRTHDDLTYALLAANYQERVRQGQTVTDLARAEGWGVSTVRNRLTEARRRELLSKAPRGKAGGELTEKAVRILEDAGHSFTFGAHYQPRHAEDQWTEAPNTEPRDAAEPSRRARKVGTMAVPPTAWRLTDGSR